MTDLLAIDGVTYWYRLREIAWHWLHERLIWERVISGVAKGATGAATGAGADGVAGADGSLALSSIALPANESALLDVAAAVGRARGAEVVAPSALLAVTADASRAHLRSRSDGGSGPAGCTPPPSRRPRHRAACRPGAAARRRLAGPRTRRRARGHPGRAAADARRRPAGPDPRSHEHPAAAADRRSGGPAGGGPESRTGDRAAAPDRTRPGRDRPRARRDHGTRIGPPSSPTRGSCPSPCSAGGAARRNPRRRLPISCARGFARQRRCPSTSTAWTWRRRSLPGSRSRRPRSSGRSFASFPASTASWRPSDREPSFSPTRRSRPRGCRSRALARSRSSPCSTG